MSQLLHDFILGGLLGDKESEDWALAMLWPGLEGEAGRPSAEPETVPSREPKRALVDDLAAVAFSTPSSPEGRGGGFSMSPGKAREQAEARCRDEYSRRVAELGRELALAKAGAYAAANRHTVESTRPESTGTGDSIHLPPIEDPNTTGNIYYGLAEKAEAVYKERMAQALDDYKRCMQEACQLPSNSGGGGGGGGAR